MIEPWQTRVCEPYREEIKPGATVEYKCPWTGNPWSKVFIDAQCWETPGKPYHAIHYEVKADQTSKNRFRIVGLGIEPY
jgi:hypothetical protein